MFEPRYYRFSNLVMEVALGILPMYTLFNFSNDMAEFKNKVDNYVPSDEIQLLFVCYLIFGLIISILAYRLKISKCLLIPSLDFIAAFISVAQAFAGFLIFFAVQTLLLKAYNYTIIFVLSYFGFHIVTINLASFLEHLKYKNRWILTHE